MKDFLPMFERQMRENVLKKVHSQSTSTERNFENFETPIRKEKTQDKGYYSIRINVKISIIVYF